MALLTQKAIFATFEEMLVEMPFDRITVSALVKRCEISSNTFYYHYQDIFALLDAWIAFKVGKLRQELGETPDWKTDAKYLLHYCQDHPGLVYHIFDSLSREQLERYVFSSAEDSFSRRVRLKTAGANLTETHIDEITQFCKFAFMGFFLKFLWNRMYGNVDEDVDRLGGMLENFVAAESGTEHKENPASSDPDFGCTIS